jgi:flagellin
MGRINTNIQSLVARRVLTSNNAMLTESLERLSTGVRINRGKDDPSGLIASENLRTEQRGLNQAVTNAERADQVVGIAEGGLQEISSLLTELQSVVVNAGNAAGLSREEKQAAQLSVDSILQTIDRVASSTNFQGVRLLNGGYDFTTSGIAAGVSEFRIGSARYAGSSLAVETLITASAQQGGLFLSAGGSSLDLNFGSSLTLEISGSKGTRELSFASGTTLANIRDAINSFTRATGLTAKVSGTGLALASEEYGSAEFVSVRVLSDGGINSTTNGDSSTPVRGIYKLQSTNFNAASTTLADRTTFASGSSSLLGVRDTGTDLQATINGVRATSTGRTLRVNTDTLEAEVTLTAGASQTLGRVGGTSPTLTITGGGAKFQLASRVDLVGQASIGIQEVAVRKLGSADAGFLDRLGTGRDANVVDGDLSRAQNIVAAALKEVATTRGRLGNFQRNVVGTTVRNNSVALENTAAAASQIRDADFATETAQLTRAQVLVQASTNILSLANNSPQQALSLLG